MNITNTVVYSPQDNISDSQAHFQLCLQLARDRQVEGGADEGGVQGVGGGAVRRLLAWDKVVPVGRLQVPPKIRAIAEKRFLYFKGKWK